MGPIGVRILLRLCFTSLCNPRTHAGLHQCVNFLKTRWQRHTDPSLSSSAIASVSVCYVRPKTVLLPCGPGKPRWNIEPSSSNITMHRINHFLHKNMFLISAHLKMAFSQERTFPASWPIGRDEQKCHVWGRASWTVCTVLTSICRGHYSHRVGLHSPPQDLASGHAKEANQLSMLPHSEHFLNSCLGKFFHTKKMTRPPGIAKCVVFFSPSGNRQEGGSAEISEVRLQRSSPWLCQARPSSVCHWMGQWHLLNTSNCAYFIGTVVILMKWKNAHLE